MGKLGLGPESVVTLWGRIAEIPPSEVAERARILLEGVVRIVDADSALVVVSRHVLHEPRDPLHGWRVVYALYHGIDEATLAVRARWTREPTFLVHNLESQIMTARSGALRSYLRPELVDRRSRRPAPELLGLIGLADRMYVVVPLDPRHEVFVGLERHARRRQFTTDERDLAQLALTGARPLLTGLAAAVGAIEVRPRGLSPRMRQLLQLLLTSASEKEAAAIMDLSPATLHQYVVRLYRRMGVTSRAELMARQLRTPPAAPLTFTDEQALRAQGLVATRIEPVLAVAARDEHERRVRAWNRGHGPGSRDT